jgi:hypothetical protein
VAGKTKGCFITEVEELFIISLRFLACLLPIIPPLALLLIAPGTLAADGLEGGALVPFALGLDPLPRQSTPNANFPLLFMAFP